MKDKKMKVKEIEKTAKTIDEAKKLLERSYGALDFVKYNPYDGSYIYCNDNKLGFVAVRKTCKGVEIDVLGC